MESAYFLLYSFTAYVAYRFLVNFNSGLAGWFVIMFVILPWLKFYSHRSRSLLFFPVLILVAISGLPFTLLSFGTGGAIGPSFRFPSVFLVLFHILFFSGYCRFLFQPRENFDEMESSFQITYLAGLFLPIIATAVITFKSLGSLLDELSFAWVGLAALLLSLGFYYWQSRRETSQVAEGSQADKAINRLQDFLSFDWLFIALDYLVGRIRPMVTGFSNLLEGEGAILWSIVFLALLITLLRTG